MVTRSDHYERLAPDHYLVDPGCPDDFERLLGEARSSRLADRHVRVSSTSSAWTDPTRRTYRRLEEAQESGPIAVLHLVQALGKFAGPRAPRIWVFTAGAVADEDASTPGSMVDAPLWGLGRTIANEHPEFHFTTVDIPRTRDVAVLEGAFAELWSPDHENQIVLFPAGRLAARLVRRSLDELGSERGGSYCLQEGRHLPHHRRVRWPRTGGRRLDGGSRRPEPRARRPAWHPWKPCRPSSDCRPAASTSWRARRMSLGRTSWRSSWRWCESSCRRCVGSSTQPASSMTASCSRIDRARFEAVLAPKTRGLAAPHPDGRHRRGLLRPLLIRVVRARAPRTGQLRSRQQLPGCARTTSPGAGVAVPVDQLGTMERDRRRIVGGQPRQWLAFRGMASITPAQGFDMLGALLLGTDASPGGRHAAQPAAVETVLSRRRALTLSSPVSISPLRPPSSTRVTTRSVVRSWDAGAASGAAGRGVRVRSCR